MGTLSNLFDLVRDASYRDIENEANREVMIALAGNTTDARDKLHRALSTRLESLWTTSPFRLVESSERPAIAQEDSVTGLMIYVLNQGDRIPSEKRVWLTDLARVPAMSVIVVILDRNSDRVFNKNKEERNRVSRRLQALNPIRLVGGREVTATTQGAAADGAAFNNADVETRPAWQAELDELKAGAGGKIVSVELDNLELNRLQADLLPLIVQKLPGRELALARRAPVFRNTVATYLIGKAARSNAELVLLANATAGIPVLSGFFDSGADFVVLTKNQFELSHRLAGLYGQKRDNRVEIYLEIVPIVAAAFIWKSLSSLAASRVPRLLTMIPKTGIAYGGTLLVGGLAQLYYASGRKAPAQLSAFVRGLVERVTGQRGRPNPATDNDSPRQLRSS